MSKKWYLISFAIVVAQNAWSADYPGCDVTKTIPLSFSSEEVRDLLSVTVKGEPCYKATLDIHIIGKNGKTLYQYHAPFKQHIAVQWDDPSLDNDAEKFVNRLTGHDSFSSTNKLPPWKSEQEYYEEHYQTLKVERKYYDVLRTKNWTTYTHPIHYEGWKVLVFDKNRDETVEVSRGGL